MISRIPAPVSVGIEILSRQDEETWIPALPPIAVA